MRDDGAPSTSDSEPWSEVWMTLEGMFESLLDPGRQKGRKPCLGLKLQSFCLVYC